jgi:hypothetical protein
MATVTNVYMISYTPQYRPADPNLVKVGFTQDTPETTEVMSETFTSFFQYINDTPNFMNLNTCKGLRDLFKTDATIDYSTELSEVDFQTILTDTNTHFNP